MPRRIRSSKRHVRIIFRDWEHPGDPEQAAPREEGAGTWLNIAHPDRSGHGVRYEEVTDVNPDFLERFTNVVITRYRPARPSRVDRELIAARKAAAECKYAAVRAQSAALRAGGVRRDRAPPRAPPVGRPAPPETEGRRTRSGLWCLIPGDAARASTRRRAAVEVVIGLSVRLGGREYSMNTGRSPLASLAARRPSRPSRRRRAWHHQEHPFNPSLRLPRPSPGPASVRRVRWI